MAVLMFVIAGLYDSGAGDPTLIAGGAPAVPALLAWTTAGSRTTASSRSTPSRRAG